LQKNGYKEHLNKDWDKNIPSSDYFGELFRISKNQIIWGANYFAKYLPSTMCWIFWYKMQDNFSFSDGEFAFTSFQKKQGYLSMHEQMKADLHLRVIPALTFIRHKSL
jgi:hypothetical protein